MPGYAAATCGSPAGAATCVMQDCGEARAQAAALLPGGSLGPVVDAVERCLHFYVTAGALRGGQLVVMPRDSFQRALLLWVSGLRATPAWPP